MKDKYMDTTIATINGLLDGISIVEKDNNNQYLAEYSIYNNKEPIMLMGDSDPVFFDFNPILV